MIWGFWRDFVPAPAKKVIRIGLGIVLVFVGTVGLVVPGIQGIATILIGLVLLSKDFPFAKRIIAWLHTKWDEIMAKRRAAKQKSASNPTDGPTQ